MHRDDWLLTKATHTHNRVRVLLGAGHEDDELMYEAFYASNVTTSASRAKLAAAFELGPPSAAAGEPAMYGEANDVGAVVSAEEREAARRIRMNPAEHHPTGDPALEKKLLPKLLDPEYSPLLSDSFEVFFACRSCIYYRILVYST